ncbi:DUF2627 domain-containing protein [Phocicoccus pinnipedialis]|uniref:DUF2627 domain-containing protein n=1 Tax=Phocicoccus pinnipedialis TaxID=110845 RepID=UPI00163F0036|nr:DUF2627 domain-containing protein [Jeotgalicoccus pinnipedialis]MBP1939328.1 membrane protein implicated in regulation of membrane protease activity [Jeotgalicoccus pinnipedialis]
MKKIIALLVLVIPALFAAYGIKLMRDAVFAIAIPPFSSVALQFVVGLILTVLGIWFVAGYILHREKKNKRAQERFMKEKNSSK